MDELDLPAERKEVKQELLSRVPEGHRYSDRLDRGFGVMYSTYSHLASFGLAVEGERTLVWLPWYFLDKEKQSTRTAGNLGGIWGINTRVIDDIMDSDGCEGTSEPERFCSNYISCFRGKNPKGNKEIGDFNYEIAKMLSQRLDEETRDLFVETLEDISTECINQDKSSIGTYKEYVDAVGEIGKLTVNAGCSVSQHKHKTDVGKIGYEVAVATQVADDIYDDDLEINKEELVKFLERKRKNFDTKTGKFFGFTLSDGYGAAGKILYAISEADSKEYGIKLRKIINPLN